MIITWVFFVPTHWNFKFYFAIWWTIADKLLINLAWKKKKKITSYTKKAYYEGKSNTRMSIQYVYITMYRFIIFYI